MEWLLKLHTSTDIPLDYKIVSTNWNMSKAICTRTMCVFNETGNWISLNNPTEKSN